MNSALTNIDEIEISESLHRTQIDLGEKDKKYDEVEWVPIDDTNKLNYKQPIKFDTKELADRLPVYREARAEFPIRASSSDVADPYDADTRLAVKNSVLSLIHTLSVKPTGSGVSTLVNEKDGQLPLMNNLRLLTHSDIDWINCSGDELQFFGCDRYVPQNVWGAGVAGTASPSHISSTVPTVDVYTNPALANRVAIFTSFTDHASDVTCFDMIVSIPLKFIHPLFDQMGFVLPNYPMKIEMGLSSLTNGCEGIMPFTTPVSTAVGVFGANGAPAVQDAKLAAAPPKLEIVPSISIKGYAPGACRLIVKCVTMRGKDAEDMDKLIASGYKKKVTFLTTDIYQESAVATSASGKAYHYVFGQNTKRPVRVWALFPPTGALAASDNTFPATVGPCYIQDCNLKVGTVLVKRQNFENQHELYNELRQYQLGSSHRQQQGACISYNDFIHGTRPYLFDISRLTPVINNIPVTFTFDAKLVDPAAGQVDPIFLVERYQTMFLDISRSKASTDVQDGLAKAD